MLSTWNLAGGAATIFDLIASNQELTSKLHVCPLGLNKSSFVEHSRHTWLTSKCIELCLRIPHTCRRHSLPKDTLNSSTKVTWQKFFRARNVDRSCWKFCHRLHSLITSALTSYTKAGRWRIQSFFSSYNSTLTHNTSGLKSTAANNTLYHLPWTKVSKSPFPWGPGPPVLGGVRMMNSTSRQGRVLSMTG